MDFVNLHTPESITIPTLGLCTSNLNRSDAIRMVEKALSCGYRYIGTAESNGNLTEVGRAIEASSVGREEMFIAHRISDTRLDFDNIVETVMHCLESLEIYTIDLVLIDVSGNPVTKESFDAIYYLHQEGRVRDIGVSNITTQHLRKAFDISTMPILLAQARHNALTPQTGLLDYCIEKGTMLMACGPLASGKLPDNTSLNEIGTKYDKSAAQVALRWLTQQEIVGAIPRTEDSQHLQENIDIFDFELTAGEITQIDEL